MLILIYDQATYLVVLLPKFHVITGYLYKVLCITKFLEIHVIILYLLK